MTGWTRFERRWAAALFRAMAPGDAASGLPALDLEREVRERRFGAILDAHAPPLLKVGLRFSVFALTWLPLFTRLRPFHRLDADAQDAWLAGAAASRWWHLRQLVFVIKAIACFAWTRDPAVRAVIERP